MTYELERPGPCLVRLKVAVPADEVGRVRAEVALAFARTARLPGFRPGKAPLRMVEGRLAQEVREETEERLLRRAWDEAVAAEGLKVAGPLGVLQVEWDDNGSFTFTGEFEVYPKVSLPPIANFQPPAFDPEPKEEEVEQFLKGLAERHATWEGVEGVAAEDGMLVEAEVEGRFPEGGGEDFRDELAVFQLGSGEVHPEIEAAARGLRVGEQGKACRDVARGDAEGTVPVEYTLTLKGLRKKVVPAVDDELAAHVGVEGGVAGLRQQAVEFLRRAKKQEQWRRFREALVSYLFGQETLPLPSRLVQEETRKAAVRYAERLQRQGVQVENLNWEELAPKLQASVEERLREELVLDQLAEELGVQVGEEEVDAAVRREAQQAGVPFAELRANLAKNGGLERIRAILRRERAVGRVLEPLFEEG